MPTHYALDEAEFSLIKSVRDGGVDRIDLVVADREGSSFVIRSITDVQLSFQDGGRTLKVFCRTKDAKE